MTIFLNLRALQVGGYCADQVRIHREDGRELTNEAFVDEIRGKNILLVTHGFNVDQRHGVDSLRWWEHWMTLPQSILLLGVLWPGDSRWLPVLDYPFEGDEAIRSGKLLGDFIDSHMADAVSLSFVSHSLGARMVLETIRTLQRRLVESVVLMAGAIDDTCLNDEYRDVCSNRKVKRISLLASRGDAVLRVAFPIGNVFAGIISRGHPYMQAALGREGPDSPYPEQLQAGWQIPDTWEFGHGDYLPSNPPTLAREPIPVVIPLTTAPTPTTLSIPDWKSDWAAAYVSTRTA